jgi:hypothetical protein
LNAARRGNQGGIRLLLGTLVALATLAVVAPAAQAVLPPDIDPNDPVFRDIECQGKVSAEKDPIFGVGYGYEVKCDKDVYAITIMSNRLVGSFNTEVIALEPSGEPAIGEDLFCIGLTPSNGFGCYASPGKTPAVKLTAGNTVIGGFSLSDPICDANYQPQFWAVAVSELGSYNDADTTKPPVIRGPWSVSSEPFLLNSSAVRCKVLNPKAKARSVCAKVKKDRGPKAKASAIRKCRSAQQAARASS